MAILKRKSVLPQSDSLGNPNNVAGLKHLFTKELSSYPVDVRSIIKSLGVSLRIEPMEDQKSGYLRKFADGWVIGVNSLHHPRRQLFTLAHELGHYILHRETVGDIEDTTLFRADGYGDWGIEREANEFAAEILMPENEFRESIKKNKGKISDISNYFGVSALAVKVRASELSK